MVSSTELELLKCYALSRRDRKEFSAHILQEMRKRVFVPDSLAAGLEFLLASVDVVSPRRRGVILSGTAHLTARKLLSTCKRYESYSMTIASEPHYLGRVPGIVQNPQRLPADVHFSGNEALVHLRHPEQDHFYPVLPKDRFFQFTNLRKHYLQSCVGVEIRSLAKGRKVTLGGIKGRLGAVGGPDFVVVVFENGRAHNFDLFGEPVFRSLSNVEAAQQKSAVKTQRLLYESTEFQSEQYTDHVVQYLTNKWRSDPDKFNREGITVIIQGAWEKITDNYGAFRFEHLSSDTQKYCFIVGDHHKGASILATFAGPIVLLYRGKALVNAHKIKHIGYECKRFRPSPKDMESIRIKNVDVLRKSFVVRSDVRRYEFRSARCIKTIGGAVNGGVYALRIHRTLLGRSYFTLLAQDGGNYSEYPIQPNVCSRIPIRNR